MVQSTAPYLCLGKADQTSTKLNDYTCEYVFHHAKFSANNLNTTSQRYEGYNLRFASHTKCKADTTKDFTVNFAVKCDATKTGLPNWQQATPDDCTWNLSTDHAAGCQAGDLSFLAPLRKFTGAFEVLFGFALCFAGARFLLYVLQFLAFMFVAGAVAGLGNVFFDFADSNHLPLILTVAVALISGCIGGYFFKRFAKEWGVTLIALVGGVMVGVMIMSAFKINYMIKYAILIILGLVAAYFGRAYDAQLKLLGTATIGAALVMHGVGAYLGGFPALTNETEQFAASWSYVGYFLGWIVFAVVGSWVQQKYPGESKDDVFS